MHGFQPKNAGTNSGWHKFLSHDSLYDATKAFLHDDKLVVKSVVSMLAAGVIPSPPSTLASDLASIQNGETGDQSLAVVLRVRETMPGPSIGRSLFVSCLGGNIK